MLSQKKNQITFLLLGLFLELWILNYVSFGRNVFTLRNRGCSYKRPPASGPVELHMRTSEDAAGPMNFCSTTMGTFILIQKLLHLYYL